MAEFTTLDRVACVVIQTIGYRLTIPESREAVLDAAHCVVATARIALTFVGGIAGKVTTGTAEERGVNVLAGLPRIATLEPFRAGKGADVQFLDVLICRGGIVPREVHGTCVKVIATADKAGGVGFNCCIVRGYTHGLQIRHARGHRVAHEVSAVSRQWSAGNHVSRPTEDKPAI